jgi:hypothetical protein
VCELRQPSLFDPPPAPPSPEELAELARLTAAREEKERQRRQRLAQLAALGRPVRVALIGCGKDKLAHAAPARELYCGRLFKLALSYALRFTDEAFILSARHGLVTLDEELAPYDLKLTQLRLKERAVWAEQTANRLDATLPDLPLEIYGLAGRSYLDPLSPHFTQRGWTLYEPLDGLGVGKRLAWLAAELRREKQSTTPPPTTHVAD